MKAKTKAMEEADSIHRQRQAKLETILWTVFTLYETRVNVS